MNNESVNGTTNARVHENDRQETAVHRGRLYVFTHWQVWRADLHFARLPCLRPMHHAALPYLIVLKHTFADVFGLIEGPCPFTLPIWLDLVAVYGL